MIKSIKSNLSKNGYKTLALTICDEGALIRFAPHHKKDEDSLDWEILLKRAPQAFQELCFADFFNGDCYPVRNAVEAVLIPCTTASCKWFLNQYKKLYETDLQNAYVALTGAISRIEEAGTRGIALQQAYEVFMEMNTD